jgi:hypothetical protein
MLQHFRFHFEHLNPRIKVRDRLSMLACT